MPKSADAWGSLPLCKLRTRKDDGPQVPTFLFDPAPLAKEQLFFPAPLGKGSIVTTGKHPAPRFNPVSKETGFVPFKPCYFASKPANGKDPAACFLYQKDAQGRRYGIQGLDISDPDKECPSVYLENFKGQICYFCWDQAILPGNLADVAARQ